MLEPMPLAVLFDDPLFDGREVLSAILKRSGCDSISASAESFRELLDSLPVPPALLVIALGPEPETAHALAAIRSSPEARASPILAIARMEGFDLDLGWLKAVGVAALVSPDSKPGLVQRRIVQLTRPGQPRRLLERANCFLPVEVVYQAQSSQEHALSLSQGGMRLTESRELALNAEITTRFRLPQISGQDVCAQARVLNRTKERNSAGFTEVGVFFTSLKDEAVEAVRAEILRLR